MPPRSRRPAAPTVITFTGLAYRATSYDVPLWVNPNRRHGRWNLAGTHAVQYFCLYPDAPFAELLRHEDLRAEPEAQMLRTALWQAQADESAVVDYSTFDKAEAAGFPPEALVEDDHRRCQAEASRLIGHGVRALLSPSAALPGSVSLTIFGPRVEVAWSTPRRLVSQMPVRRIATSTPPPPGLTSRVRYFGDEHRGLADFAKRQARGRRGRP